MMAKTANNYKWAHHCSWHELTMTMNGPSLLMKKTTNELEWAQFSPQGKVSIAGDRECVVEDEGQ
jgi:hypothetical protein